MLDDNLAVIKDRIKAAALKSGRSAADIKLVAVSKRITSESIIEAIDLGQSAFGENYIQEAVEKIPAVEKIRPESKISWHFIGNLQSNKAKKAAELFDVIETVDSIKIARSLESHLARLNKTLAVYVQVNIGRENQKSGILPENCEKLLQELSHFQHLQVFGLMIMPPYFPDPEKVRPYFRELRHLSQKLAAKGLLGHYGPITLSMGMSGDFEVAVEEGATVIRIGTAIFGARKG